MAVEVTGKVASSWSLKTIQTWCARCDLVASTHGALDVVGDRALLAAVACFIAASSTTLAAPLVVAELLTESANGCWIDATVFEWERLGARVGSIISCTVAHGTNAIGLSEGNVMSMSVLLDVCKKLGDGCVGRAVDVRVLDDNCAHLRYVIDAATDAVHLR
jgi:hypothetical protein